MTEEEKRRAIEAFLAAEQTRSKISAVLSTAQTNMEAALAHSARRRAVFDRLSQQGITWEQLRDAYNDAFDRGHTAMVDHHLSYFYAGIAIAYKETHSEATPEAVADFVRAVYAIPDEIKDRESMIARCLEETGVDVSSYDEDSAYTPPRATMNTNVATRKDRAAVEWMRKSGITQTDLEYEKDLGYKNGWNSGFNFSVCYGATALVLHRSYQYTPSEIEPFIERVDDLRYEEITAEDILERAREEAGVDVSQLAKEPTT